MTQTENILQTNLNQNSSPNNIAFEQKIHPNHKNSFSESFFHWWKKIAIILLIAQGLMGIWESIKFIAIDYQKLDILLELHQIQTQEINHLIARVFIIILTTFVNIFMAIRLNKVRETTAHNIDLFIATILIIGTKFIQEFLIKLNLLDIISNFF